MSLSVPNPVRRRRAQEGSGELLRDEILDAATEVLLDAVCARYSESYVIAPTAAT